MIFTLVPTAWAEGTEAGTASVPELENSATEGTSGGIDWKVEDGLLTISAANPSEDEYNAGQMKDYTSQMGETVTDPTEWYALKDSITEIKIEEGVTYLGNWAFSYLTNVVKANIPASITGLGNHIFRGDTALTTVEWASDFKAPEITDTDSNSTTYTGNYVPTSMFDGCTSLGSGEELSAWLPDSFTGVGCAAFRGTQFTVDFGVWDNLTYIGAYGFAGMPNLDSFTLSNEITLGLRGNKDKASNAFNSSGLKSLTVEDEITEIPIGMCDGCEQLSSVDLADSVRTIAMTAFRNTKALKEIDLKKVQTINSYAFQGSGLTALVLPESVEKVESRAFEACTSLTKVTINAAELMLDNSNTFAGCSSLSTVVTSADSKINGLNTGAFGPDSHGDYVQAPVESIEINGTVNTLNFSTLASLKDLTINGKNNLTSGALPSGFENLVINGDSWSVDHYQFQSPAPVKHLVVSAAEVSDNAGKTEAAFRSNFNLETAQFTGTTVKLQAKMFMGCTSLNWLDLSAVDTLTVGSGCFGDDTNSTYGASTEKPNRFNKDCVIYAKDAAAARTLRDRGSGLDKKGIVLIVNGGTVDVTAATAGFGAVSCAGYTAQWYDNETCTGSPVKGNPVTGETYYAKWTKNTSVVLTSNPVADEDGKVSAPYTPSGAVTLSVQDPGADWLYVWMKDGKPINGTESSLTLCAPSDSGNYSVKVVADGTGTDVWTSNAINVTITKATGTASVSMDDWAYGEEAKKPAPTSATNGTDNVTYLYKVKDAADSTYSDAVPTAAGSYTVKATFPETVNYNAVTATDDFTITKATYNMTGVKFEDASYTYDGNEKTLTISGTLPAGVAVAYENNKLTNAGSVTAKAKFTIADSNNYCAIKDMTATLTITKAKPTVSISAKPDSLRGGGKVTLTVTGVPEEGKVIVTCDNGITVDNANSTYSAVLPNRTVDYTFTLNYTGVENGNYSDATDTCTVSVTRRSSSAANPGNRISVPTTPNGTVTVSPSAASKGETVTITTKPSEGYELGSIEVLDKNGDSLKLKDLGNGKYSFVMPDGKVSVEAEFVKTAATSFADVPANAYFADAVKWAVDKGITNGLSDTMFGPYESCTRAQIVTFLWRAAGSPEPKTASSFTDVPASAYYAKAVAWAIENGITNGMTETMFAPNATCTRGQSVTFLYRALKGTASGSTNFTDVKPDAFYADAVNWAVASGVTNGTSATTFSPNADCTRAEIVTFLYRAYQGK